MSLKCRPLTEKDVAKHLLNVFVQEIVKIEASKEFEVMDLQDIYFYKNVLSWWKTGWTFLYVFF